MAERETQIAAFLQEAGWGDAERGILAADASFRRYDRLKKGDQRAVLMDAPPPKEDVRPFLAIARHLTGLGYSAPRIFADDTEAGFLLLEDLGDDTFTRLLRQGDRAGAWAVLVATHGGPVPANVRGRLSEAAAQLAFAPYRA